MYLREDRKIIQSQLIGSIKESEKHLLHKVNYLKVMALDVSGEELTGLAPNQALKKTQILSEGDYCSILRPSSENSTTEPYDGNDKNYCIFVARHLMHSTDMRPRQEILWVKLNADNDIILLQSESINGIPLMFKQSEVSKQLHSVKIDRTGTLQNCKKYIQISNWFVS